MSTTILLVLLSIFIKSDKPPETSPGFIMITCMGNISKPYPIIVFNFKENIDSIFRDPRTQQLDRTVTVIDINETELSSIKSLIEQSQYLSKVDTMFGIRIFINKQDNWLYIANPYFARNLFSRIIYQLNRNNPKYETIQKGLNGLVERIHLDWEEIDRQMINGLNKIDIQKPKQAEALFSRGDTIRKFPLGFGWTQAPMGLVGASMRITAYFYYYKDSLISYTIKPQIPYPDSARMRRYLLWYRPSFPVVDTIKNISGDEENTYIELRPFWYNEDGILRPLNEYENSGNREPASKKVLQYMSPESGTAYGMGGGATWTMFPNRKMFNAIKDSLSINQVRLLLYSLNPASRLTAIEYCIKNNLSVLKEKNIEAWIEKIYNEIPEIYTLHGRSGSPESTRKLVKEYSKINTDK